ncbi:MAG: sigma-54-dependent transcriptional regulator [Bdellovibrionia bacterium]
MSSLVLVIDDELSIRQSLTGALEDEGYRVLTACSAEEGIEVIRSQRPDVVLLDIWMPRVDGIEALRQIRAQWSDQIVLMMSGHGTIETAVRATKLGAFDFIEKPLSLERLLVLLQNASALLALSRENQALRKHLSQKRPLIGEHAGMAQVHELIKRAAPTKGSVLVTGENGTGKELVVQRIHALSSRFNQPLVEVNCAAIPEELIESELFGHEKGAFTGATQLRRGKFDLAHGGTLFLDEIGDMSLKTQAKILRILQEQKFERVGGFQTISVDVRVIAATNKDLRLEISNGNFREDLFYRLNVISIVVPPLRDRVGDIPLLTDYFLKEFCTSHGRRLRQLSSEAMQMLMAYPWPGNVRELRNLMERLVILTTESEEGQEVSAADLLGHLHDDAFRPQVQEDSFCGLIPKREGVGVLSSSSALSSQAPGASLGEEKRNLRDARHEFERSFILKTLEKNDWNVSRTAQILGIERSHLHRKIRSYGLES